MMRERVERPLGGGDHLDGEIVGQGGQRDIRSGPAQQVDRSEALIRLVVPERPAIAGGLALNMRAEAMAWVVSVPLLWLNWLSSRIAVTLPFNILMCLIGCLLGTLIGAMTLGLVNKLLEPYAGAVLAKVAVLVALMLFIQRRPRGLSLRKVKHRPGGHVNARPLSRPSLAA